MELSFHVHGHVFYGDETPEQGVLEIVPPDKSMEVTIIWKWFKNSVHLLTLAVRVTLWNQNLSSTSVKRGCMVRPTRSVSLSEMPLEDLADVSKTTLTLVVVLCSLHATCIGK